MTRSFNHHIGNFMLACNDNFLIRTNKLKNLAKRLALVETHPRASPRREEKG